MKKTILAVATALIGTFAMTTTAADNNQNDTTTRECPAQRCPDCVLVNEAFEGIELTDTQKTAIENLRTKRAEQARINREQARADRMAAKEQAREERRRQRSEMRDRARHERREALTELKTILTPEQYTEYLENIVVNNVANPRTFMNKARLSRADKDIRIRYRDCKSINAECPMRTATDNSDDIE